VPVEDGTELTVQKDNDHLEDVDLGTYLKDLFDLGD